MKKIIRTNTFETNSSSVHSLSISSEGRESSEFELNEDGMIEISFGEFGKDERLYSSQYDKLSYLITCLYYLNGTIDDIYDSWNFRHIKDAVCKYAGAKGIKILEHPDPYIDHQSVPEGWIEIIDIYDEDAVINFVFNKYVSLKTDSD